MKVVVIQENMISLDYKKKETCFGTGTFTDQCILTSSFHLMNSIVGAAVAPGDNFVAVCLCSVKGELIAKTKKVACQKQRTPSCSCKSDRISTKVNLFNTAN